MSSRIFVSIAALISLSACSEYQRVLKSTDSEYKFAKAKEYFEDEKYNKAYPIFDELLTVSEAPSGPRRCIIITL
ncbi:MAG: hypothetical protein U5L96_21880 [Owenweeksia sp.]|nr:hypothetical protein [Owenweeksia sp.]